MKDHLGEKITAEQLASRCHISESYYRNLFKKAVGVSFYEYLTDLRIQKAKELLWDSRCSIPEICEVCGFSSSQHFHRIFRSKTGETPGAYRRKFRSGYTRSFFE